jgi:large-conductance mechanosensitive channel
MTGEAVGGAVLKGLQDPKKIQELILVAVRKVNHDQGAPAPSVENAETTVTLLREIRDLLRRDG